jgi:hypothetical protein
MRRALEKWDIRRQEGWALALAITCTAIMMRVVAVTTAVIAVQLREFTKSMTWPTVFTPAPHPHHRAPSPRTRSPSSVRAVPAPLCVNSVPRGSCVGPSGRYRPGDREGEPPKANRLLIGRRVI